MTKESLKRANDIEKSLELINSSIKVFEWACSDGFEARQSSINILGGSQSDGFATIPRDVFKSVCQLALMSHREEARKLEIELSEL